MRLDREKFEAVVARLEHSDPNGADLLREAVVDGPAPGDVFQRDSEEPAGVSVVTDVDGDRWSRAEGGWLAVDIGPHATPWPWARVQHYFGPLTVLS